MSLLVGNLAPDFSTDAVINGGDFAEDFTMSQFMDKKYVLFFFYPLDFTFVCPTEILAFQKRLAEFDALNVQVIGASTDSKFSHWAWLNTPQNKGGIQGVTFPLVADYDKTIASNYGVLAGRYTFEYDENDNERLVFEGAPIAYRGTFLIDKQGIIRHQLINDTPLGRSVDEALRMVKALQYFEEKGEVCPADWNEGSDSMKASHEGVASYLASH